jgi:probable rRNA maturation factor
MYYGRSSDFPFGDICISVDTARRHARRGRHALIQELALLVVHGLLHLLGFEDGTIRQRKRMFRQQARLFRIADPSLAPPDLI